MGAKWNIVSLEVICQSQDCYRAVRPAHALTRYKYDPHINIVVKSLAIRSVILRGVLLANCEVCGGDRLRLESAPTRMSSHQRRNARCSCVINPRLVYLRSTWKNPCAIVVTRHCAMDSKPGEHRSLRQHSSTCQTLGTSSSQPMLLMATQGRGASIPSMGLPTP